MIAKCKAIAHGRKALEYILKEGKLKNVVRSHQLAGRGAQEIYEEMTMVSRFNSRCKNKFLRIEIGIAPTDEKKMSLSNLQSVVDDFVEQMGLNEHQLIAVTHKDTDNLHVHIIANRMDINGAVYDTTFVSNKASRIAEELARKYGLTVANDVAQRKREQKRQHENPYAKNSRQEVKKYIQQSAYRLLSERTNGEKGMLQFIDKLSKLGIEIIPARNKQDKVYGLRFECNGETLKSSEIGREFGYRSLFIQFGLQDVMKFSGNEIKGKSAVPILSPNTNNQTVTESLANTVASTIDNAVEAVANTFTTESAISSEIAEAQWQRKLRFQAKKKRGRRM
ncbi:hypothetical protein IX332_001697 [Porphyromonas levii]|uniref:relaxase/mobilization nuclease domain-containing protein n=1 Tax=Porphyromonas levii TaxID=28114 RepID=UPI001B8CEFCA|nr:relaxase/mobilization nuclease domain-containing protein [Porphyromonas levii]MBR8730354.1 hypothetical protein [Porphyromonas levii]